MRFCFDCLVTAGPRSSYRPEEVRDRILEAAEFIPVDSFGTTDDCGFSPFADDTSTSRETAFAKFAAVSTVRNWLPALSVCKPKFSTNAGLSQESIRRTLQTLLRNSA